MAQSRVGMELKNPQLRAPQTQIADGSVAGQTGNRALTILHSETFNSTAGNLPAGWSVTDSSSPASGVVWKWTNVGHTGSYPTAAIQSATASDGWMIVDSDLDGDASTDEHTVLISPAYNVSTEPNVAITFSQMMREFQNDICNVAVSGDNGATWTYFTINEGIGQSGTANPDMVFINVSSICGNASQMRVKFSWQGAWDYGWQIDDLAIVIPPDNEIVLNGVDFYTETPSIIWPENIRYTMYPTTQRDPAGVTFRAVMSNNGAQSQTGVTSTVQVRDASTTVVYTGVTTGLNLNANARDTAYSTTSFALPATAMNHTVDYAINYPNLAQDEDLTNNTASYGPINVTPFTFGMDRNQYAGTGLYGGTSGGNDYAYRMGNHFMVFNNQQLQGIQVAFSASTIVGTTVYPFVIEIDDQATSFQDLYANFIYDGGGTAYERTLVASNISTANNMVLYNFDLPNTVNLVAGKEYIIGVGTYGGPATTDRVVIMNGERNHPGAAHTVLYTTGSSGLQWFYTESTPVIRAMFDPTIGVNEVNNAASVNVYPNPANNIATVEVALTESAVVMVEVMDLTGKLVASNSFGNLSAGSNRLNLNVSDLSEGTYFCTIVINGERITKKM
ncbi:MAG TPA: hypothetical protein DCD96_05635, partial [Flavobacteriales bacterium]|nr:hypothetical protein [Flavobacteriales bacterium]